jgi:hypothetical protein
MAFNSVMADQLYKKAALRDAKERGVRERVCAECVHAETDFILGGIHSELKCMRCGARPCVGAVVVTS